MGKITEVDYLPFVRPTLFCYTAIETIGAGRLTTLVAAQGGHALAELPDSMTFESGGQGLWSMADDYLSFARLLAVSAGWARSDGRAPTAAGGRPTRTTGPCSSF